MKKILLLGLFFLSPCSFAANVSLDFNEFLPGETQHLFAGPYYSEYVEPDYSYGGSDIIAIDRLGGEAFALYDLDVGLNGAFGINIYADVLGGGTVTDAISFGTGDWLNVTAVYIDGIDTVGWGGNFYAEHVLVGAAVPIPAAVWLFGSALAGLGWLRRTKTA